MDSANVTPVTPGVRHRSISTDRFPARPLRSMLTGPAHHTGGRNHHGRVTTRHRGGGEKRQFRAIDWKRDKREMIARVEHIEYDPNRSARIARLLYPDGERRYILAPMGLTTESKVITGVSAPIEPGNALPLASIPIGTVVHNLEIRPGKGAQVVRGAGVAASIQSKENEWIHVKLPSGEVRRFDAQCFATVGQVGNEAHKNRSLGKAGRKRHMGWRPEVRGVAMNPRSHPHGGGEGRSGIGMTTPKSPWGKPVGRKTRTRSKYSNKFIIQDRRIK